MTDSDDPKEILAEMGALSSQVGLLLSENTRFKFVLLAIKSECDEMGGPGECRNPIHIAARKALAIKN